MILYITLTYLAGLICGVLVTRKPELNPAMIDLLTFIACALLLSLIGAGLIVLAEVL